MIDTELPVAVIGRGRTGKQLLRVLRRLPAYQVTYLLARRAGAVLVAGECLPVRGWDSWAVVLADPSVRAVVLCVPPHAQIELASAAVAAGKHVLVDKPVGLAPLRVAALRTLAVRHDRQVGVLFELACHPLFDHVAQLVERGEIGTPAHATFRVFVPKPWLVEGRRYDVKAAGGPFVESLVNGFHLAECVLGPMQVTAAECYRDGDATVGGVAIARHDNRCVTTFEASRLGTAGARSGYFEVTGTDRSLVWEQGCLAHRRHILRIGGESCATAEVDDTDAGLVGLLQRFRLACDGASEAIDRVDLRTAEAALRCAISARIRCVTRTRPVPPIGGTRMLTPEIP